MRVLVVAATAAEVGPFVAGLTRVVDAGPRVTRYQCARPRYRRADQRRRNGGDRVVVFATAGRRNGSTWRSTSASAAASERRFEPGTVVHVVSDRLAELGAEDGDRFLTIQQMGLLRDDEFPFTGGRLVNDSPPPIASLASLRRGRWHHGQYRPRKRASIARVTERFDPDVESMEGAAFMYSCLIHGVPFAQVRAVSNIVERRNRSAWKLDEAIAALGAAGLRILES